MRLLKMQTNFPVDPDALVRLPQILGFLSISRSNFLNGVKAGKFPAPIRLGRSVLWRAGDIRALSETRK